MYWHENVFAYIHIFRDRVYSRRISIYIWLHIYMHNKTKLKSNENENTQKNKHSQSETHTNSTWHIKNPLSCVNIAMDIRPTIKKSIDTFMSCAHTTQNKHTHTHKGACICMHEVLCICQHFKSRTRFCVEAGTSQIVFFLIA